MSPASTTALANPPTDTALPTDPGAWPLSFAQQRLWFLNQMEPNQPTYNVPFALRLEGRLDAAALQESLTVLVERHEILRTTYPVRNGEPVQEVRPPAVVPMPVVDLSDLPGAPAELEERLRVEAARGFDLARELPIRASLYRLGPSSHLLFLNIHHIAFDEWSVGIAGRELAAAYNARIAGKSTALPDLPIQYIDFAAWQRESAASEEFSQSLQWWREQLAGPPPMLEFPPDHLRPPMPSRRGGRIEHPLPARFGPHIRDLSRREGVTPFILLFAAFQGLLHRCTGQTDLVIGTPIAGRPRRETEGLVGFFVNMLAVRTDAAGDPSFRDWLRHVKQSVLGAFSHDTVSFEKLVETLKPERNGAENPFFNIVFAAHGPEHLPAFAGLDAQWREVSNGTAKFDLNLTAEERDGRWNLLIEYSADLYERERLAGLARIFETFLGGLLDSPDARLGQLPLLDPAQRQKVLVEWNRTETDYPRNRRVDDLFAAQAARTPDSVALEFGGTTLSYRELDERSNRLARFLQERGVHRDVPVGICVERSAEMIVGILAILKAGGAYLPLDTAYPPDRLRFMVQDAAPRCILTQERLGAGAWFGNGEVISMDRIEPALQKLRAGPVENDADAESIAYIIYTSGSTGVPKGICIPHRGITRLVCNTNYMQFGTAERIAQVSNASFDAATFEIWGALLFGGRLVGIPKEVAISPRELAAALREHRITSLFLTAALFNQIAADLPDAFAHVSNLLVGGEALDPASIRRVLKHGPPARLLNGYGPTESTTFAMWHLIANIDEQTTNIPIGKPLANTTAYVLDAALQPMPVGCPGELFLGGDGLARGYLNRPELNAARFVPHPFSTQPGARLYRTGDLVRQRPDGAVEFLSRLDHQVKIRGFRIELGEIEVALARLPGVAEVAVLARQDQPGEKRLVAYVAGDATVLKPGGLREGLRQSLPDYMVPSTFVILPRLPLNKNGKVDRAALPVPEMDRVGRADRRLARNALELDLMKIWQRVLGNDAIAVDDNFFDLGGHSLLGVRLFAEIERHFQRALPVATLFKAPTIEQLARVLDSQGYRHQGSCIIEIQPKGTQPPIFWLHTLGGGGGGGLFTYRKLALALGDDQPSYGIIAPATPHADLEGMARDYIAELKAFQPRGPYRLGGYCFGGVVAYEMARQLSEAGDEVAFLALIDNSPPGNPRDFSWLNPFDLFQVGMHFLHAGVGKLTEDRAGLAASIRRKLRNLLPSRSAPGKNGPRAPRLDDFLDMSRYPADFREMAETHWRALSGYVPKPYPGRAHLFRARQRPLASMSPRLGWGRLVRGGIDLVHIRGKHETILDDPHVGTLAQEIGRCLGPLT